jgi:L-iditol 2-dehydrogenase
MKQVLLTAPGQLEIREVPVPEPAEGELVVKINSALTCGTDLKAYVRGHALIPMPGPLGHEYSGIVARTGRGVDNFSEGDEVMGVHSAPCHVCRYCRRKLYNLCETLIEKMALGAFAEYMRLPAHVVRQHIFPKPVNLSFEEAALLEPLSCVVHPYNKFKLHETETVLIIGAGPIGLMHLAYLKTRGVNVIVSDFFDDRLLIAERIGADHISTPGDVEQCVHNATDSLGVDLVVECTGQVDVWESAVNHVRRGGVVVLFGGCAGGSRVNLDAHRLHYDELTLLGAFHYTPGDVKTAYHLLANKNLDLSGLISGVFPLQEVEKAFKLLKEGKGIKYALKPSKTIYENSETLQL